MVEVHTIVREEEQRVMKANSEVDGGTEGDGGAQLW